MLSQPTRSPLSRRAIYRGAKKHLRRALWRAWTGTAAALNHALQRLLQGRNRAELLHLARNPAVAALLLTATTMINPAARADSIELSDIARGNGGFALHGAAEDEFSGCSVSARAKLLEAVVAELTA